MNEYGGGDDSGPNDGPEDPANDNVAQKGEYADVGAREPGGSSDEISNSVWDAGISEPDAPGIALDDATGTEVGTHGPSEARIAGLGEAKHADAKASNASAAPANDNAAPLDAANDTVERAQRDDARRAGLRDVSASHPEDYVPSDAPAPQIDRPHQSPEAWIDAVNPDRTAPGRDNNCGECARATQSTWQGEPAVAAAMRDPKSGGEGDEVMVEAAGAELTPTSIDEVGQRLADLGPGSSAVVGIGWQDGDGHWFNAVNDSGSVKAVDGQLGRVEGWPPSKAGVGYDASEMESVEAIFFDANGRVVGFGAE
jgi:hypothetical protein